MQAQETYQQGNSTYRRHEDSGTYYNEETPDAVKRELERARRYGTRVRLFYGDAKTGKAWLEEYNVTGTIGRSMGPCKIPLLIASSRSHGGPGILDSAIVAIRGPRGWLYRHPQFSVGIFTLQWETSTVFHAGEMVAQFSSPKKAWRWVAFMRGERLSK